MLAVLLLQAGHVVPLDRMVELIWGDRPPAELPNAVQTHVSRLRKALACDPQVRIEAHPPGYVLRVDPLRVDLHRFRALVAEAGAVDDAGRAGELLREALALWQGRPLADVLASDALQRLSANLEEDRLTAVQQRLSVELRLGRHAAVLGELAELAAGHPMHEGFGELLVLALYRCGRQADALAELQRIRARMVEELGIEPGPGLRSLQQRILRADQTLDPPAVTRTGPAQLPADIAGFRGRAGELAALDALALGSAEGGPPVIVALSGTAGVGKTATAVHWAHRVRGAFPDGQLYLDLRGYDPNQPMTTGDALNRLLEALGVADVPVEVDARAGRFRTEVADRRMLIMLDNASAVEQVRALLPGTASCVVVITSRDSLAGLVALHGATRLDLDPLAEDDAEALLRGLIGERATADPVATELLAARCARLPLALRVAAELAVSRPGTSLARLVEELRDGRRRLRLLDGGGDARAAMRSVLSWSYRHLPADAARLFRLLGCHPGPDFDLYSAAALGRLDPEDAGGLLTVLVRAHMVQPAPYGRYGMHDLLRAYAAELAESDGEPAEARTRLFDYYLAAAAAVTEALYPVSGSERPRPQSPDLPPLHDEEWLRAWLTAERPNLVAVCGYAAAHGWPAHAVALAATVYRYLESGHYADALTIHGFGLRAARELGDVSGEAHALTNLGLVHRLLGRYGPATEHLRQALDLHRRAGDRNGEARTLSNLGIVEDRLGRPASAASLLEQALALYRELGNRHGTAAALTNLGGVHTGARAADHLAEALALFRALGDRGGAASALCNLGETETQLGRYASAAGHLEEALALFREMNHRYGQAIALSNLGPVCSALGRHEAAIEHLDAALDIFRDTGHRYGEASVLNGLGEALHAAGRPGALAHHEAALRISTETGDRDELARAEAGASRARSRPVLR